MHIIVLIILTGLTSVAAELSRQDFLMSFPEIAYDDRKVVFSNEQWSAVFASGVSTMFTMPRDSLDMAASQEGRGCRVVVGNATYVCNPIRGNSIIKQDAYGNTDLTITPPNAQAMTALADAWSVVTVSRAEVTEEIGPLCAGQDKVWFGLVAFYQSGKMPVSGLGWFDTNTGQFGRVYASALRDLTPRWVGVRDDTVWVYCGATGAQVGGQLISYSTKDGGLGQLNLAAARIPGDTLLNAGMWRDFLLLATEDAVSIWPQGDMPWVWQTDAYASRENTWLKFVTFDIKNGIKNIGDDFFPLPMNSPAMAFAKVGDWLELYAPQGVEATMPTEKWKKIKEIATTDDWGCGDSLCFARVKVSVTGANKEMDLLDTPIVLLQEGETITKIGIRAGWVPAYQVVPVLMKK